MEGVEIGRIVHFVLPGGEERPMLILRVWNASTGYVNGLVFRDGSNDDAELPIPRMNQADVRCDVWMTSVPYDGETKAERSWHWPKD